MRPLALSTLSLALAATLGASGCEDPTAAAPAPVEEPRQPPVSPTPAAPTWATYVSVHGSTDYVLYDDSTFVLVISADLRHPGTYSRAGTQLTFAFDGAGAGSSWEGTGTLTGDTLAVTYGSDTPDGIEDEAYVLSAGPEHIYLANADGSAIRRLTQGAWPSWSPDGRRVAFHRGMEAPSTEPSARGASLHLIDIDGTREVRVGAGGYPDWSPDGRRLVFMSDAGIAVTEIDRPAPGTETLLAHHFRHYGEWDMGVGKPAWSPDGERIAFEHFGDGGIVVPAQVYVMNADGSEPHTLTRSGIMYAESDPSWSPDGSRIVFWSFGHGIATVNADGGTPYTEYADFPGVAYGARPAWAPSGAIAFNTFARSPGEADLRSIPARGRTPITLVQGAYHAAWSPDGSMLAFVRWRP